MPVVLMGHGVALIQSAASITIYRTLCTAPTEADAEYLRRLDPTVVTVVDTAAYDPEWSVIFSDGRHVEFGHYTTFNKPTAVLRSIAARAVYLAKRRAVLRAELLMAVCLTRVRDFNHVGCILVGDGVIMSQFVGPYVFE
jgi:hypothetical protein